MTLVTQTQIGSGGGGGADSDTIIINLCTDILSKIPSEYKIAEVAKIYPILYENSMNTVLKQVNFIYLDTTQIYLWDTELKCV